MSRPKLWKYLSREATDSFYATEDPDAQAAVLAEALQLPDYKGDARSAIKLDFCSYNLSFAQSAGFSATQTSAVVTLAMDLLTAIGDGAAADDLKESFKSSLVPLLSVKSAELAAYSADEQEQLAGLEAAVKAAQVELEAVMNPPAPEPTGGKKGAPPAEAEAPDADRVAECEAALAEKQMMLKETVERLDEGLLSFAPPDVKNIMDYFSRTLLSHLKLYQFAMVQPQEARVVKVVAKVETTIAPPPLAEARSAEEVEAEKAAKAAAAEASAVEAAEKAAAEEAAAAEAAKVAEEEAKKAAEEELRARQPATLEEAVEKAVAVRLLDERAKLAAEYAAREEQLMMKIRNIEAQLTAV